MIIKNFEINLITKEKDEFRKINPNAKVNLTIIPKKWFLWIGFILKNKYNKTIIQRTFFAGFVNKMKRWILGTTDLLKLNKNRC